MKPIKQIVRKSLKFLFLLVASLLTLQAAQALPDHGLLNTCDQAWQELQETMTSLSNGCTLEDLLKAQAEIVNCQLALAQKTAKSDEYVQYGIAAIADFLNVDIYNPSALFDCSLTFVDFENVLLKVKAALPNPEAFLDNSSFYKDLTVEKLQRRLCHHEKLELQDAVKAAALTPEEQQLWDQFQSTLTKKYKKPCKDFLALVPSTEGVTDPKELQNILLMQEIMEGHVAVNKLLEQGCLYEFLNVLLTKRNDTDSSLNSFHQLQEKLTQFFLNNNDLNELPLFQAQVDMLAYRYEKEGAITAVTSTAK